MRGAAPGVRIFLHSRRTVGVDIWCVDVGGYHPHGTGPGGFPGIGGAATDRVAPIAEVIRGVGVHLSGGGRRGDEV